jgi:UDP-N-acetylglucosamine--N-acetylmuramyl-(pentapeptide) pyrophosphoryl-undecaprenol N-acetylglucosamine transferase
MKKSQVFMMAGGGTAGHVVPAVVVARELRRRGYRVVFFGTRHGFEARVLDALQFPVEWIEINGLKGVGWRKRLRTLAQLPGCVLKCWRSMRRWRPVALFSMGGYAAGPPMLAAWLLGTPIVVMEPNAMPGFTTRKMARVVKRALVSFPETMEWFPDGVAEVTGLPVREEFFDIPPWTPSETLTLLITGGSQGSHRLNQASRESWPLFRESGMKVKILHQAGYREASELKRAFASAGLEGQVTAFITDMPSAFAEAGLVVCRSGAGAVAELAAAGRPSILVPFPFAADDHQLKNARAMERAGAARVVLDQQMDGARLFHEVRQLASDPERLAAMGQAARSLARPGAARRAADVLEEFAREAQKRKPSG